MGNFFNRPLGVTIIGSIFCIGAILGFYFLAISKQSAALNEQTSIYNDNKSFLDPNQLPDANKKVADANTKVQQAQAEWNVILAKKNPTIDLSNIFTAWKQLTN